jgi:hypothetical protein
MAVGTPLTRITLGAASVADDLGYVALADLARALGVLLCLKASPPKFGPGIRI